MSRKQFTGGKPSGPGPKNDKIRLLVQTQNPSISLLFWMPGSWGMGCRGAGLVFR